jgi:hypothetical protein
MSGPIDNDVSGDTPAVGSPSYEAGSVSVGTTATLIAVVPAGHGVTLYASAACHIGDSGVTSTTGFALPATTVLPLLGGKNAPREIWGITGTGTSTVSFIYAAE